jgi:hypothetical protein
MPTNFAIKAVYTDLARAKYAAAIGNLGPLDYVATFKVGIGGWLPSGSPRTPDPSLTDLDILVDASRPAPQKRYPLLVPANGYTIQTFSKAVGPMSVPGSPPLNILTVPCQLTTAEYNSDGVGNPVIWEIGLFDSAGDMVVYGTFSGLTKGPTNTIDFTNALVL